MTEHDARRRPQGVARLRAWDRRRPRRCILVEGRSGCARRHRRGLRGRPRRLHSDRALARAPLLGRSQPVSEEHTSELQSPCNLVCRLLLEKKKKKTHPYSAITKRYTKNYYRATVR